MTTTVNPARTADEIAEHVFASALGAMETLSLYLGDRLGWWTSLAGHPATPGELARRTGTQERYVREWLEMQAVYGNVEMTGGGPGEERTYSLTSAVAEVLTDPHSLAYLGALPRIVAAAGRQVDALATAYAEGGGVSWATLGPDAYEAQAALNRPWFEQRLGPALAGVPEVHELLSRPGARVVDVGCGAGWSSVALATAYPGAEVTGVDVDEPSLAMARAQAEAAGLADRVRFVTGDGGAPGTLAGPAPYDVAFFFECLHDLAHPVEVLAQARAALRLGGVVVVMDEAVADELRAPGDSVEQVMYGYSTLVCLPDGLSTPGAAGTGTVMRPDVLRAYAEQAGFARVEVLPIEDFALFRFYLLQP